MRTLEPGLLVVLRVFAAGQIVLLGALATLFAWQESPPHPVFPVLAMLVPAIAFAGVALWAKLPDRLDQLFLPLCVGLATAVPFTGQIAALSVNAKDFSYFSAELSLALSFPLLMVAWQYRFAAVLWFATVTTGVDLLLANLSVFGLGPSAPQYHHVVITRVVVLLAAGYIITRLMNEQRTQRARLQQANAQAAAHAAAMEQLAVSQERNRIARELHDTVAHSLSGLTITLEAMRAGWREDPILVRELLDRALGTARSGMSETRRALTALRASPLESLGLVHALQELAENEAQRAGAQLKLRLPTPDLRLTADAEQVCYRIAQEALENAVRHARPSTIELALVSDNDNVELCVRDDGRGFRPNEVSQDRFGLRGMQERAALVNGSLTVDSEIGSGTAVIVQFQDTPQNGANRD